MDKIEFKSTTASVPALVFYAIIDCFQSWKFDFV